MKYFSFAFLLLLCACYGRKPDKTGLEGQPMPQLKFVALDSITQFSTTQIPTDKTTIFFSFEPWCPFCKAQTDEWVSKMDKFKNVDIYMLSSSRYSIIEEFKKHYKLSKFPNVHIFVDSSKSFRQYFNDSRIPFTAVYGPDKKLRQAFIGKTNVNLIAGVVEK
jgi:thiol-disulfide isomerase/thioredoxin